MKRYYSAAALLAVLPALTLLFSDRPVAADDKGDWATLKGQVVWPKDELPEAKELKVDKEQNHCLEKGPIKSEEWVVNPKNKGIRWVFVWLAPVEAGKPMPIHPDLKEIKDKEVVIDQPCCRFEPHALGMREGQVLVAKNSAPIAHNLAYTGFKNPGGNPLIPPKQEYKVEGLKADKYPLTIKCSIHGWMSAYVRIFDHPYFAVTDADGNFEIKDAPAGEYRLMMSHDSGFRGGAKGRDGEKITIKGGQVNDLGKIDWKFDK